MPFTRKYFYKYIGIKENTRDELKKIRLRGEGYDEVIQRGIRLIKKNKRE